MFREGVNSVVLLAFPKTQTKSQNNNVFPSRINYTILTPNI